MLPPFDSAKPSRGANVMQKTTIGLAGGIVGLLIAPFVADGDCATARAA
jgi:hypothetical protein